MFRSAARIALRRPMVTLGVGAGLIGGSVAHRKLYRFDREITVKEKYTKLEDGETMYMITDTSNNIYKVENSFWWRQYNRAEEWNKVDRGSKYYVEGSGIRNGYMGWYPKVYRIKPSST